jgi:uncharacterized surface protein with fasciclin (FAS1) repeats
MNRKTFLAAATAAIAFAFSPLTAPTAAAKAPAAAPSIVDVAIAVNSSGPYAGQFDTLIAAVQAADPAVLKRLTSRGQSTVFAPVDAAFEEIGLTPDNVSTVDTATLTSILLYHVVTGRRDSNDVLSSTQLRTLQGGFLKQSAGRLTDNRGREATIIVVDVPASNGIIHAIDRVVLP